METLNVRAGFLSNHEVLTLLKAQQAARGEEIAILKKKKTARAAGEGRRAALKEREDDEIDRIQPGDLATVSFEAIKYLEAEIHPLRRQTGDDISALLDKLETLPLTKAERLQIINLAPRNLVALTICIEDLEIRFPEDERLALLATIKNHLGHGSDAVAPAAITTTNTAPEPAPEEEEEEEEAEEEAYDEEMFVDEGLAGSGEKQSKEIDEE